MRQSQRTPSTNPALVSKPIRTGYARQTGPTNSEETWFVLHALDEANFPLEGAQFVLEDEMGHVRYIAISEQDGAVRFSHIFPGRYVLKQTYVPVGYAINPAVHTVNVGDYCDLMIDSVCVEPDTSLTYAGFRAENAPEFWETNPPRPNRISYKPNSWAPVPNAGQEAVVSRPKGLRRTAQPLPRPVHSNAQSTLAHSQEKSPAIDETAVIRGQMTMNRGYDPSTSPSGTPSVADKLPTQNPASPRSANRAAARQQAAMLNRASQVNAKQTQRPLTQKDRQMIAMASPKTEERQTPLANKANAQGLNAAVQQQQRIRQNAAGRPSALPANSPDIQVQPARQSTRPAAPQPSAASAFSPAPSAQPVEPPPVMGAVAAQKILNRPAPRPAPRSGLSVAGIVPGQTGNVQGRPLSAPAPTVQPQAANELDSQTVGYVPVEPNLSGQMVDPTFPTGHLAVDPAVMPPWAKAVVRPAIPKPEQPIMPARLVAPGRASETPAATEPELNQSVRPIEPAQAAKPQVAQRVRSSANPPAAQVPTPATKVQPALRQAKAVQSAAPENSGRPGVQAKLPVQAPSVAQPVRTKKPAQQARPISAPSTPIAPPAAAPAADTPPASGSAAQKAQTTRSAARRAAAQAAQDARKAAEQASAAQSTPTTQPPQVAQAVRVRPTVQQPPKVQTANPAAKVQPTVAQPVTKTAEQATAQSPRTPAPVKAQAAATQSKRIRPSSSQSPGDQGTNAQPVAPQAATAPAIPTPQAIKPQPVPAQGAKARPMAQQPAVAQAVKAQPVPTQATRVSAPARVASRAGSAPKAATPGIAQRTVAKPVSPSVAQRVPTSARPAIPAGGRPANQEAKAIARQIAPTVAQRQNAPKAQPSQSKPGTPILPTIAKPVNASKIPDLARRIQGPSTQNLDPAAAEALRRSRAQALEGLREQKRNALANTAPARGTERQMNPVAKAPSATAAPKAQPFIANSKATPGTRPSPR